MVSILGKNKCCRKYLDLQRIKYFIVLHNMDIYSLFISPGIVKVKESRWGQWTGQVSRMDYTQKFGS